MTEKTSSTIARLCEAARAMDNVEEGTSCTQSSFKTGGKPFLFVGMQGGRGKVMFKLDDSRADAARFAKERPDEFQVGPRWVTARFSDEQPLAAKVWRKWLKESYRLGLPQGRRSPRRKAGSKK